MATSSWPPLLCTPLAALLLFVPDGSFLRSTREDRRVDATCRFSSGKSSSELHLPARFSFDRLFNQQVIDQARIQELTAAHANKRNALPGDMNRLSQARVLHQSDLPRLIAQREEQARKEAEKLACKARGKQRAKSKQVLPSLAPMAAQESQESDEEPVFPTSSQLPSFWPVQLPPPFLGSDQMIMVPPPSLPQASSSAIPLEPPFPSWQQQGPLLPRMPPFL
ncbi:uncharacterized protein UTRI_05027 [Ustilago trichophora]|uniref:Uncharacterized protein n=1 Tax=Ustilago trichophora TaxID=86804 RepID=A0A5C3EB12_9BASI|nr:uncharacterized protein UTRI_05027 [Ustilago trichophora]